MQLSGAAAQLLGRDAHGGGHFGDLLVCLRQELVQRRVEQTDRDGKAVHDLEQLGKIAALIGQQFGERLAAALLVLGQDHLTHRDDPGRVEEHVLGPAEADPLGAEFARGAGILRSLGVGAHRHAPDHVGPFHQDRELAGEFGLQHRDLAFHHLADGAVDGDDVAFLEHDAARTHCPALVVDADRAGAADAGLAHAARDHRRMRSHAAAGGQDAL